MNIPNTENDIGQIYERYVDSLCTYARNMGFSKEDSMDAIHDVFCKFFADKKSPEQIENIRFYLFKSLKNRLFDIIRTQREFVNINEEYAANPLPFTLEVTIEDDFINKEEQQKLITKVNALLSTLTDRQREIIYLKFMQKYDYKEISILMGISVPACYKLISKTLDKLRGNNPAFFFILLTILKHNC